MAGVGREAGSGVGSGCWDAGHRGGPRAALTAGGGGCWTDGSRPQVSGGRLEVTQGQPRYCLLGLWGRGGLRDEQGLAPATHLAR